MASPQKQLGAVDIVVIVFHFLVVLALGIWSSYKANRSSTTGYFLAGRSMSWWLVGLSLYVTNIGSGSFIGLAGTASASGYAVIAYEFTGLFCLLLLGFIFMPVYIASGINTVPEYLKLRFGSNRLQLFLAITSIVLTVLTALSSEMYAGTLIIQQTLGWNIYWSAIVLLSMTAVYTIAGGLTAVIYTDALQAVVMLVGAFILAIIALVEIGGLDALRVEFMSSIPNSTLYGSSPCGIPQESAWHIFRPANDPDYPWPGVMFGITLLSAYFFCTNQVFVQRSLAAKNITHSKAGSVLAAYLKLLPMLLMIWPGMISRALYTDEVACQSGEVCEEVCGNPAGCSDIAYLKLVLELMPTGLKGLMMAAMIAALMSSLTSTFNSLSSVVTLDVWKKFRKQAKEIELLIVGRITTLVLAVICVLWLPLIQAFGAGQLFVYIQSMTSYLSPPIFALYTMGYFFERTTEVGAFYGLMFGELLGVARMISDYILTAPGCGEIDSRPGFVKNFHYLHFALVLYAVTCIFIGCTSYLSPRSPIDQLRGLTWWQRHKNRQQKQIGENSKEILDTKETEKKDGNDVTKDEEEVEVGFLRSSWNFICGVDSSKSPELTEEQQQAMFDKITSLQEKPFWKCFVSINGLICLGVGIAVFAVFR